ncbi:hypothetical protein [Dongia sedimenti]|uniref:Uncharacterized protein n=1 Tax=Dongia sedimenti TaxID=3064282 RepID=A0ABU0YFD8_9PROT|nr:hypothetical protein [Rhodospirillaceae bacterium R-7]
MTLTLPKILILLAICWLVWRFLRKNNIIGGSKSEGAPRAPQNRKAEGTIEDMVKCPKCGAYVPVKGGHDCPGA